MAVSPEEIIADIGKKLGSQTRPSKDLIVKLLRQAVSALSDLEQLFSLNSHRTPWSKSHITPLSKSLVKHGLLWHKDKDVRLLVAMCFCEIMRVLAPDPNFGDKTFKDVFELFITTFAELGDTTSPYFPKRVKILQTVDALQCCHQMLDVGCDDLILKMFQTFFSVVREEHSQSLMTGMLNIMELILNQEEITQPLLEVILQNFRNKGEALQPASYLLAVRLIQDCSERVKPAVCGYLTSCMLKRDSMQSELRGSYHDIVYELYLIAPDVIAAIIPNIIEELLTDQVDARIKSLNLIGKLLALPENQHEQEHHHMFVALLQRFSDKVAEVRLSALRCARACYMANPLGMDSHEIISYVKDRLLDFDSSVRAEAVVVVCELATCNMKNFPAELVLQTTERLRDKMASVRKVAMKKLLEAYRHYCIKCSEGQMELNQFFEQIPCNILMLSYDKSSKDVRLQTLELLLAKDLFPGSLSVEERMRHWIFFYSLFSPAHAKALNFILSLKRRLQTEMQVYLSLRKAEKEISSDKGIQRMRIAVKRMSVAFSDPVKAEESFYLLNQIKDNRIFDGLAHLLDEAESGKAKAIQDELSRKISDKNPCTDFLKSLCSKCIHNVFNSEHVHCILQYVVSNIRRDNPLLESSVNLLVVILNNFPLLLRGTENEDQFKLLIKAETPFSEKLIQTLAKAGPFISMRLSDIYPSLEDFCLEGNCGQAKAAVSAIAALAGTSEQFILANLIQKLVKFLYSGQNIITVLQSLGCLAHHSASTFQKEENSILSYIKEKIFKAKLSGDPCSLQERSGCHISFDCKAKIYGIKVLVKNSMSKKGADGRPQIASLLDMLFRLLKKGDFRENSMMCEIDIAHLKLAAAKSVLQLSGRWDMYISPQMFHATVMVAKDDSSFVRRLFLDKVHKLLKEHAIPSKYACAFPLAVSDCVKDLQELASSYLVDFIAEYGRKAQIEQHTITQAGFMTDSPAYIVVFLVHVLAHDEAFPPGDCSDEDIYTPICMPLYKLLHSLVNGHSVGHVDFVKNSFSCLLSNFRAIKKADDAADHQETLKLHKLSEIGTFILQTMKPKGVDSSSVPGRVLLPLSLYAFGQKIKEKDTSHTSGSIFDVRFLKKLTDTIQHQLNKSTTTIKNVQKGQKDRLLTNITNQNSGILGTCNQTGSSVKGIEEKDRQGIDHTVSSHTSIEGGQSECSGSGCSLPASSNEQPLGISSITLALSQTTPDLLDLELDTYSASIEGGQKSNRSDLKGMAVPSSQCDPSDCSSLDHLNEIDVACRGRCAGGRVAPRNEGVLFDSTNTLAAAKDLKEQQPKKRKSHEIVHLASVNLLTAHDSVASRTRRRKA